MLANYPGTSDLNECSFADRLVDQPVTEVYLIMRF